MECYSDLHTPYSRCHFEWPWVTLSDLAQYSVTRNIAHSLCDSWTSCYVNWLASRLYCVILASVWRCPLRRTIIYKRRERQSASLRCSPVKSCLLAVVLGPPTLNNSHLQPVTTLKAVSSRSAFCYISWLFFCWIIFGNKKLCCRKKAARCFVSVSS